MDELALVSYIALGLGVLFLVFPPRPGGRAVRMHLLSCGGLVLSMDLLVEIVGTSLGLWEYNYSVYFLFGRVPVELLMLFGGGGVLLASIHMYMRLVPPLLSARTVFLALVLLGLGLYGWIAGVQRGDVNLLVVTLPLGLWGLHVIRGDADKARALILALFVAVLDWLVEVWIVGAGSYDYANGFVIETPLTYALLVLAVLGWLDGRRRRLFAA